MCKQILLNMSSFEEYKIKITQKLTKKNFLFNLQARKHIPPYFQRFAHLTCDRFCDVLQCITKKITNTTNIESIHVTSGSLLFFISYQSCIYSPAAFSINSSSGYKRFHL